MARLVTIATFTDQVQAHILRCRLEVEGVPAFVAFEHHISMDWFLSQALGGVRVQVPETYAEKASEILAGINAGEYALVEEETGSCRCPKCGHGNVRPDRASWNIAFLTFCIARVPLPFLVNNTKCMDCGYVGNRNEF
jgi:Putative prokaryotic signal transducing protein